MGWARLVSDERPGTVWQVRVLTTWRERLRGLLGTSEDAGDVMLARCAAVHTVGMRYAIDVAFVGELGEVLRVCRGVAPGAFLSCPEACCVMERPAREAGWVEEGEHLWVVAVGADSVG